VAKQFICPCPCQQSNPDPRSAEQSLRAYVQISLSFLFPYKMQFISHDGEILCLRYFLANFAEQASLKCFRLMNQILLKLRRKSQNVYLLLLFYCFLHNFQCCSKCHRIYPHFQNKFLCFNVKKVRCPKMSISLILRKIKIIVDSNKGFQVFTVHYYSQSLLLAD
jgi:hypothetical protein